MTRYSSISDVLTDNGTTFYSFSSFEYSKDDRFFFVNGQYYRTNTDGDSVISFDVYNSFDDLHNGRSSARNEAHAGASHDLFMVVPRAALGLTGFHSPVPEIDPAGIGSALALLGGGLGLLERRRKRA
jgi:hypothetical protein